MTIDPATLRIRYPAFAQVADETIAYWLTDAARIVTDGWGADQEPATFALAAHNMALQGVGADPDMPAVPGLTSFRSGSFSLGFSEDAARVSLAGGYGSTVYGREFQPMLRRNAGGPQLVGPVC